MLGQRLHSAYRAPIKGEAIASVGSAHLDGSRSEIVMWIRIETEIER